MRNLVLALVLLSSTNLWAAETNGAGFYAGGAFGFAELDDDSMGDTIDRFDDNSGAAHFFGGYQFNRFVAVEMAIDSLGVYEGEEPTADINSSYSSLTFSLLGRIPLVSGLSLFVQGGGGVASIYQVVDGTVGSYYYDDADYSSSGFATVWGAGLSFLIPNNEAIEIRAGYQRTDFEVDAITVDSGTGEVVENEYDQSIKQVYIGAAYHF